MMRSRFALALVLLCPIIAHKIDNQPCQGASSLWVDHSNLLQMKAEVFPVPTASRCIVIMVCQYMIIYTALALCRTFYECFYPSYSRPLVLRKLSSLESAAQTMTYAPMLCVLFIATQMRVEFLSNGTGQPQPWVQTCMYALTFAVFASALVALLTPFAYPGKQVTLKGHDLEQPQVTPRFETEPASKVKFYGMTVLRYLILLGLYGGLAGVIVGNFVYLPPGMSDLSKVPAPAPAIMCSMILSVAFFLTQLVIALCQTYTELKGVDYYAGHIHKIVHVMKGAASTIEFAPMIAIVFLAARMRALQLGGEPQAWAQDCMYASTGALCLMMLMSIAVPCMLGGQVDTEHAEVVTFHVPAHPSVSYAVLGIRATCLVCFYACVATVIYATLTLTAPAGHTTQPLSPTLRCVLYLAAQFFFVYGGLTILDLAYCEGVPETHRFYSAIEAAKASIVPWAPMLAILFVTTRMYALLITEKKGAPQAWAQDGMCMATWSLLISFLAAFLTGLVTDTVEKDDDGHVTHKFSNSWVSVGMTALRYFTMVLLYGGIITVVAGLFLMTPETANGRGSVPVISDIVNSTPLGHAPPDPTGVERSG